MKSLVRCKLAALAPRILQSGVIGAVPDRLLSHLEKRVSLNVRWNLITGVANAAWGALLLLAVTPFYLRYLGLEAYGLVGFFMALQAIFALLDLGLTPTLTREVARCRATGDLTEARDLLHTLATVFWGMAGLIALLLFALSGIIAEYWLQSTALPLDDLANAVKLMGCVVACRWPLGLYMGALIGAERLTTVSLISMAMLAVANLGALAVLVFVSPTIEAFFIWQALAGLAYVVVMRAVAWRTLRQGDRGPRFDLPGLRRVMRFSAGMGATGILGVIFAQSDKIVLSKILSLEAVAQYTLASLIARTLQVLLIPAFNVLYPRMTRAFTAGDEADFEFLYRAGTRLLLAVVFPVAAFVAVFAVPLVEFWTGNGQLAVEIAPLIQLSIFGSAMNGVMVVPYALQLAAGRSSLAALISATLLAVFIPMLIVLATRFGVLGGAIAWAVFNALYVLLGTWVTHRVLLRGRALSWLFRDVGLPAIVTGIVAVGGGLAVQQADLGVWASLMIGGFLTLLAGVITIGLSPALMKLVRQSIPNPKSLAVKQEG